MVHNVEFLYDVTLTSLQEIFGPVLAVHVYPDEKYKDVLKMIDQTSQYALTGAIYAEDQ